MKTKIIKLYTCEYCNTESGSRASAIAHENGCLKKKEKRDKEAAKKERTVKKFLAATSIDEILLEMERFLGTKVNLHVSYRSISNSHDCPKGGVTNWSGRDNKLPTSYKGWSGQISGEFCVYQLTGLGIFHSGSGGPGSVAEKYGCDISFYFFEDDFPNLKQKIQEYSELSRVAGDYANECSKKDNDACIWLSNAIHADDTVNKLEVELDTLQDRLQEAKDAARAKASPTFEKMRAPNPIPYSQEKLKELYSSLRV